MKNEQQRSAQGAITDQRTVRCEFRTMPTNDDDGIAGLEYTPDEGWFVDEVLPAFASNGAGVVIVMRPIP